MQLELEHHATVRNQLGSEGYVGAKKEEGTRVRMKEQSKLEDGGNSQDNCTGTGEEDKVTTGKYTLEPPREPTFYMLKAHGSHGDGHAWLVSASRVRG